MTERTGEAPVNRPAGQRWTHIRVPIDLADRLADEARHLERLHQAGRVALPAGQCERVPVWLVIARALDEQRARRARSARPRRRRGRP